MKEKNISIKNVYLILDPISTYLRILWEILTTVSI